MEAVIATPHQQNQHDRDQHDHDHDELPTSGSALTRVAISATLHCLTGCAIGEVLGMVIGTALGFSALGTVALAVGLAFAFGYLLTSLPLLRAGFPLATVIPIALASDTLSIATMEIVDNAIMLGLPGAMEAGVGSLLFWGSLSFALVIAGAVAVPVNRWLIGRGKGHAVLHETGVHGGPSPRVVALAAAVAFVFGSAVLVAEIVSGPGESSGHTPMSASPSHGAPATAGHGEQPTAAAVRGLASTAGLTLDLERTRLPRGPSSTLSFRVVDGSGAAVRNFDVEHDKRMHLIVVRRDMTRFQHLHPSIADSGTWSVRVTLPSAGSYRVFADFNRDGRNVTLAGDVNVGGSFEPVALPPATDTSTTEGGYAVRVDAGTARAGNESALSFDVKRAGKPVALQPYLGARGHLVALRSSDLAYLHAHPTDGTTRTDGRVSFTTQFATAGRYRLYLQFKHEGLVRTAPFTIDVAR